MTVTEKATQPALIQMAVSPAPVEMVLMEMEHFVQVEKLFDQCSVVSSYLI